MREYLAADLSLDSMGIAMQQHGNLFPGGARKTAYRVCSCLTEVSNSSSITPLPDEESNPSTSRAPNTRHPDGQTPVSGPNSKTSLHEEEMTPAKPWSCPWMGHKVRRLWNWSRSPSRWTGVLIFFSVLLAISSGVFSIMAWHVAVQANRKADMAIVIAKYQYKLDEYNASLTLFATKLAIQARDDGRLSNKLQYYAICMSDSVGPGCAFSWISC